MTTAPTSDIALYSSGSHSTVASGPGELMVHCSAPPASLHSQLITSLGQASSLLQFNKAADDTDKTQVRIRRFIMDADTLNSNTRLSNFLGGLYYHYSIKFNLHGNIGYKFSVGYINLPYAEPCVRKVSAFPTRLPLTEWLIIGVRGSSVSPISLLKCIEFDSGQQELTTLVHAVHFGSGSDTEFGKGGG